MTISEAFGDVVRELRDERSETQEVLAARSELNRGYLSNLENGSKRPSLKTVFQIAEGLCIEPAELLGKTHRRMEQATASS